MIQIKLDKLYVRDPATNTFTPLLAIKGDKGDTGSIGNIGDYMTSETGDSEELAVTQKGATQIKTDLEGNISNIVGGTLLTGNLLGTVADLETYGVYHFRLDGQNWTTIDELPSRLDRYGMATAFVRSKHSKVLILWGGSGPGCYTYVNRYGSIDHNGTQTYVWHGWAKFIDSTIIGDQTVAAAESINCVNVSSLDELTALAKQKKSCAIYFPADVTITGTFKVPLYSIGMLHGGSAVTMSVVSDAGVIYTAFYNPGQGRWYGTRQSNRPDFAVLPAWPSVAAEIENGDMYPPTANNVQKQLNAIYWQYVDLASRIQALENA